jgi:hypothetical protein
MTARQEAEHGAHREEQDKAGAALLVRLAAIREASTRLRRDPRDSTELLRRLRELCDSTAAGYRHDHP